MAQFFTPNVFIDTCIFKKYHFNFDSIFFKILSMHVVFQHINLFLTDITVNEIKKKINEEFNNIELTFKDFLKKTRILDNPINPNKSLLDTNFLSFKTLLINRFENFVKINNVNILSTNSSSIENVFCKYFNSDAPFNNIDKKSEFPDAFVIETLISWCRNNKQNMFVLSEDHDFISSFRNIECIRVISSHEYIKSLDLYNHQSTKLLDNLLFNNKEIIIDKIKKELVDTEYILSDVAGEIKEIKYLNIIIDKNHIIYNRDNFLIVDFDITVEYNIHIKYNDYHSGFDGFEVYDFSKNCIVRNDSSNKNFKTKVSAGIFVNEEKSEKIEINYILINEKTIKIYLN